MSDTLPAIHARMARQYLALLRESDPEALLAVLGEQAEVAALVEASITALRQWRGFSDRLRQRRRGAALPLSRADDAEARVYREAAATASPWRKAKEGR